MSSSMQAEIFKELGKCFLKLAEIAEKHQDGTSVASGEPAKKRQKKQKDPNAPKRPQSGFFLFLNDSRARLRRENPNKKGREISVIAGQEWQRMTDQQKAPYMLKGQKNKDVYDKQMKKYKAGEPFNDDDDESTQGEEGDDDDDDDDDHDDDDDDDQEEEEEASESEESEEETVEEEPPKPPPSQKKKKKKKKGGEPSPVKAKAISKPPKAVPAASPKKKKKKGTKKRKHAAN